GEHYNPGPPTTPRQAATVILLSGGDTALEVLLVRRNPQARFMGGVWVFPGGSLDGQRETGRDAHRVAAARELREEAAITLGDHRELVEFSRWITPEQVSVRFDTRFFLAPLPAGQRPSVDGQECVELGWFTPRGALDAHGRGEIELVFPTIKHLEQLSGFPSATAVLERARAREREVRPVQPRVVVVDGGAGGEVRVLLPGEPGYDAGP
ncbi:MAG: NUDIX hydrolase, partial [Solirubrobacterales bacterium]|nr:NUDIX hydrolase [Solirubrobacterales bacterium]